MHLFAEESVIRNDRTLHSEEKTSSEGTQTRPMPAVPSKLHQILALRAENSDLKSKLAQQQEFFSEKYASLKDTVRGMQKLSADDEQSLLLQAELDSLRERFTSLQMLQREFKVGLQTLRQRYSAECARREGIEAREKAAREASAERAKELRCQRRGF